MDSFQLPSACVCRYRSNLFGTLRFGDNLEEKEKNKPKCDPKDFTQRLDDGDSNTKKEEAGSDRGLSSSPKDSPRRVLALVNEIATIVHSRISTVHLVIQPGTWRIIFFHISPGNTGKKVQEGRSSRNSRKSSTRCQGKPYQSFFCLTERQG